MVGRSSLPDGALFLGLDSSTQSVKATVLNNELIIVASEAVNFDSDLPHYKTEVGFTEIPRTMAAYIHQP